VIGMDRTAEAPPEFKYYSNDTQFAIHCPPHHSPKNLEHRPANRRTFPKEI